MTRRISVAQFVRFAAALLVGAVLSANVRAATVDEAVKPIQDRWAEIKYRTPEKQQADQYRALAEECRRVAEAFPAAAEPLVWEGIIVSSEAGARGGLGALSLAKEAKTRLEASLKIDDKALGASAYTSLATLYAKVPGWPIGFGDNARAEEYFKRSLVINPDGIDPNFFYGEYLVDRNRLPEARQYLTAALKAPVRPGRELADNGRRQEIQAMLAKLEKEAK
jgi:tetratricopeptide (TPR) repeat protein